MEVNSFICPLCGEEHPEGARFCPETGQSLETPSVDAADNAAQREREAAKRVAEPEQPAFLLEDSGAALDLEGWMDEVSLRRALEGMVSRNRSGQARQLIDLLVQEPDNATAWVWLAREVLAGVEQRACLQKALQINPEHSAARLAWEGLEPMPQMNIQRGDVFDADDATEAEDAGVSDHSPVVEDAVEPAAEEREDGVSSPGEAVFIPDEPLVHLVDDPQEPAADEQAEQDAIESGARVFEPLPAPEHSAADSALQEEEPDVEAQQPEWQAELEQEADLIQGTELPGEAAPAPGRLRRRLTTSEIVMLVVLALLLLTNLWTALSVVRLERTVRTLETQMADTYTLVTTFQEMVLDLVVRIDMLDPAGP